MTTWLQRNNLYCQMISLKHQNLPWVELSRAITNNLQLFQCNLQSSTNFSHQFMPILNWTEIYRYCKNETFFRDRYWYCVKCNMFNAQITFFHLRICATVIIAWCMMHDAIKNECATRVKHRDELGCIIVVITWIAQLLVITSTHFGCVQYAWDLFVQFLWEWQSA